jgi:hypothetical protein
LSGDDNDTSWRRRWHSAARAVHFTWRIAWRVAIEPMGGGWRSLGKSGLDASGDRDDMP